MKRSLAVLILVPMALVSVAGEGPGELKVSVRAEPRKASRRLTVAFWIWALYDADKGGAYYDYDSRMREAVERGFNCIRIDDGAGLFCAPDGIPRGKVLLRPPFGKFTPDVRQMVITTPRTCDPRERLLELFRAADRHGVSVILSSWYYLHTNWFLDESINRPLFEGMTTEQKFAYFTDELNRIIALLRENKLDHRIAYAELFNEFDGLPFTGRYGRIKDKDKVAQLRQLHEAAIARLKAANPGVRFAYDGPLLPIQRDLVPRNADILALHPYYLWSVYTDSFEKGSIRVTQKETDIPEEAKPFLVAKPYTVADVIATRGGNLRTVTDWLTRVRLYASLDTDKAPALDRKLEETLRANHERYFEGLLQSVEDAVDFRDACLPEAELAMTEGVTYCASNRLRFEENSDLYWQIVRRHMEALARAGFFAAIPRTCSGPEDPTWTLRAADYRKANGIFAGF